MAELLEPHRKSLEALTDQWLRRYIDRRASDITVRSKEFNDPVWGTLQVRPLEVVVLDSPLLQRLRRIRQLGVAHLVYPAAVHTRFEHSLGVAHQVGRLWESVTLHPARHGDSATSGQFPTWQLPLLRLAGICHDIGHGLMSHVSENALVNSRECEDIRLEFQAHTRGSKLNQLSEIAAYYMLGSPAFLELLTLAVRLAPDGLPAITDGNSMPDRISEYQSKLQQIIVGKAISSEYPLIHELISGPFDADKLDYMPRDAAMCGVPVVTDVPRLIQKVRYQRVGQGQLPKGIAAGLPATDSYVITGMARSGARTLDELALGRALLFDKIYRHQKVRAAEAMVASIINELLSLRGEAPALLPYKLSDEDVFSLTPELIETLLSLDRDDSIARRDEMQAALDLSERLRQRQLLARGFAFSSKMPLDAYRNDAVQKAGVEDLIRALKDSARRKDFVRSLIGQATEIANLTDKPTPASIIPGEAVDPYVWISAPIVTDGSGEPNEIGHAWLIGEHGEPVRRADQDYAETRGWSDAYVATRDLGLIFCPHEIAPCIYLAAEALVSGQFGVRIPATMLAFAKQDPRVVGTMRRQLAGSGWYRGKSRHLLPDPLLFDEAGFEHGIRELMEVLDGYSGPLIVDPSTGKRTEKVLTELRVKNWLKQFEDEELVDAAFGALRSIKFIGRETIVEALKTFLDSNDAFRGGSACPLGQPKDSSSIFTYFAGDVRLTPRTLSDALLAGLPIVFVDDYIGRGSAAIRVLEDWFGVEPSDELNQERGVALPDPSLELLRLAKIAVVFATGKEAGGERLRARAYELGFEDITVYIHDTDLPALSEDRVVPNADVRSRIIEFCRERGQEALADEGRSPEWAADRALGYGNDGLLVVSSFNTPTAALTCLWHDGPQWSALFPRRPKR